MCNPKYLIEILETKHLCAVDAVSLINSAIKM